MPTTSLSSSPAQPESARITRGRYRLGESSAARWRLLTDAATALASEGARPSALSTVLSKALAFLAFDAGVLIHMQPDGMSVRAAHGPVLPVGARIQPSRTLQGALEQNQLTPLVRQDAPGVLRIDREQRNGLEVLVPLRFDNQPRGILALLGPDGATAPNAEDLSTLQALGTLLAAALTVAQPAQPRIAAPERAALLNLLTPRELQVFKLLPSGMTNAEMGRELGIATGTVKVHVERILHKLDLGDRTQAAVRAADFGLGG